MTTGTATSRRALILSPGEAFGAYTILAPLGRGGMVEVYRARDNRLGREVALKILPDQELDDPERVRRFEQEARAASALAHPNIVVVFESGEAVPAGRHRPVRFSRDSVSFAVTAPRLVPGTIPAARWLPPGASEDNPQFSGSRGSQGQRTGAKRVYGDSPGS